MIMIIFFIIDIEMNYLGLLMTIIKISVVLYIIISLYLLYLLFMMVFTFIRIF